MKPVDGFKGFPATRHIEEQGLMPSALEAIQRDATASIYIVEGMRAVDAIAYLAMELAAIKWLKGDLR
jgi:hypothetical protein